MSPLSRFDNTEWSPGPGTWVPGDHWEPASVAGPRWVLGLSELGTWVNGFRPSYYTITLSGATSAATYIWDKDESTIAGNANTSYNSGQLIPISFGVDDIGEMYIRSFISGDYFNVTNIEFWSSSSSSSVSSSSSSTA